MDLDKLNMTSKEYVALSAEERIALNKQLKWNTWHNYHETYPDIPAPAEIPCIINGTLIIG